MDNDNDFYFDKSGEFTYENQKKRNDIVGRISSVSYHIFGVALAISTFCLIFFVIFVIIS